MQTTKEAQLSALMDSEMSQQEMDRMIKEMRDNSHLKDCWNGYHLIGDALRRQLPDFIDTNLHSKISTAIQNEPTHFLPRKTTQDKPAASRRKEALGFALAASVTAIAVLGVMQVNDSSQNIARPAAVASAESNKPVQVAAAEPVQSLHVSAAAADREVVHASVTTDPDRIHARVAVYNRADDAGMDYPQEAADLYDYLVNYNEYARTRSLQGEMYPAIQLVGYAP